MNAWISISAVVSIKYFVIFAIFLKWEWNVLQIFLTCWSKFKHWSTITPIFRADGLDFIFSSSTWIKSKEGLERYIELIRTSYALPWFNLSPLFTIQRSISVTQWSILTLTVVSSLKLSVLKDIRKWMTSAYRWYCRICSLMISAIGDV